MNAPRSTASSTSGLFPDRSRQCRRRDPPSTPRRRGRPCSIIWSYVPSCGNRDGKTNSLGLLDDGGINTDHLSALVKQRTTRVAGINGCIGWIIPSRKRLSLRIHQQIAVQRADHASGNGLILA